YSAQEGLAAGPVSEKFRAAFRRFQRDIDVLPRTALDIGGGVPRDLRPLAFALDDEALVWFGHVGRLALASAGAKKSKPSSPKFGPDRVDYARDTLPIRAPFTASLSLVAKKK